MTVQMRMTPLVRRLGIVVAALIAAGLCSAPQASFAKKKRRVISPFRAGTAELHAFTGYAFIDESANLGADDAPPHYKDNVPDSAPLVGLRLGYNLSELLGAEIELKHSRTAFRRDNHGVTLVGLRANALAQLGLLRNTLRPFALLGVGAEKLLQSKEVPGDALDAADADLDLALYGGVGAKYYVTDRLSFRLDGRVVLSENQEGSAFAPVAYEVLFGGAINLLVIDQDADRDGIATSRDRCPLQPEDPDGFEDDDGCPDSDNDGDGIADELDKCPLDKENPNGVDDADGCPDQDADGDLIEDRVDKCPNKAEDKDGFEDTDGCPDPDNDGDGLLDKDDKCPNGAEDKDNYLDDDGCPDPDNDGDGVFDKADKCPDKLETHNGFDDEDGCPDTVPKKVAKEFKGTIPGIYFALDSAKIDDKSNKVLDKALAVLKEYPGVKLEIAGHTDNSGYLEYNLDLSRRRAMAVKSWFVSRGIDATRLVAVGYGRSRPIAPNTNEAGRAKNRRIEFVLLARKAR